MRGRAPTRSRRASARRGAAAAAQRRSRGRARSRAGGRPATPSCANLRGVVLAAGELRDRAEGDAERMGIDADGEHDIGLRGLVDLHGRQEVEATEDPRGGRAVDARRERAVRGCEVVALAAPQMRTEEVERTAGEELREPRLRRALARGKAVELRTLPRKPPPRPGKVLDPRCKRDA